MKISHAKNKFARHLFAIGVGATVLSLVFTLLYRWIDPVGSSLNLGAGILIAAFFYGGIILAAISGLFLGAKRGKKQKSDQPKDS